MQSSQPLERIATAQADAREELERECELNAPVETDDDRARHVSAPVADTLNGWLESVIGRRGAQHARASRIPYR
jgi:hypothetical protein